MLRPISDEDVQRVVGIVFDPQLGSKYWLDVEKELGLDVRENVTTFDDLSSVLGSWMWEHQSRFDGDLKTLDMRLFVPLSVQRNGSYNVTGETGGTTGKAKRGVFNKAVYWDRMIEATKSELDKRNIPRGGNWLWIGPTGPHSIGDYAKDIARAYVSDGQPSPYVFTVDLDTRFIKLLGITLSNPNTPGEKKAGIKYSLDMYLAHILHQTQPILDSQEISKVFTTATILTIPPVVKYLSNTGLDAILHGGTALDADTHKILVEEDYRGIPLIGVYGSSITGPNLQKPREEDDDWELVYIPFQPFLHEDVVDKNGDPVKFGEEGQVRIWRLTEDFLIPGFPERDRALLVEPYGRYAEEYPWPWLKGIYSPYIADNPEAKGVY
ncbi:AMP-dependent synthetase [Candidatus Woesearchaeota archaeon]|nr:AMP-dependent synthetase [Candidatus Woesearchaeota archaeon]